MTSGGGSKIRSQVERLKHLGARLNIRAIAPAGTRTRFESMGGFHHTLRPRARRCCGFVCVLLNGKKQKARPKRVNLKVRWRAKFAMRYRSEESARRAILVWEGRDRSSRRLVGKGASVFSRDDVYSAGVESVFFWNWNCRFPPRGP